MLFTAEGISTGQFLYCGKKAALTIGNVLPLCSMPEGTIICNLESKTGDRGTIARCSGNYASIIAHNEDTGKTRVRLPSGKKKIIPSVARAMIGVVAGGGRIDKPMLKAGTSFHKYKAKRNSWPRVRGVAMNPVEHPHGMLPVVCARACCAQPCVPSFPPADTLRPRRFTGLGCWTTPRYACVFTSTDLDFGWGFFL